MSTRCCHRWLASVFLPRPSHSVHIPSLQNEAVSVLQISLKWADVPECEAAAKHLHPLNQRISTHFTTTTEMLPISTDGIARRRGERDSVSVCVCGVCFCVWREGGWGVGDTADVVSGVKHWDFVAKTADEAEQTLTHIHTHIGSSLFPLLPPIPHSLPPP